MFFCAPEKKWACWEKFSLQGGHLVKSGHREGGHNPASAAKCRLELPAKAQPSGGDTAGAAFSTVFCFLGMPMVPWRSSLANIQHALTFLVQWPPAKEINASHFLSHWESCLIIYGGENRILRRTNQENLFFYPSTIISTFLFKWSHFFRGNKVKQSEMVYIFCLCRQNFWILHSKGDKSHL